MDSVRFLDQNVMNNLNKGQELADFHPEPENPNFHFDECHFSRPTNNINSLCDMILASIDPDVSPLGSIISEGYVNYGTLLHTVQFFMRILLSHRRHLRRAYKTWSHYL